MLFGKKCQKENYKNVRLSCITWMRMEGRTIEWETKLLSNFSSISKIFCFWIKDLLFELHLHQKPMIKSKYHAISWNSIINYENQWND